MTPVIRALPHLYNILLAGLVLRSKFYRASPQIHSDLWFGLTKLEGEKKRIKGRQVNTQVTFFSLFVVIYLTFFVRLWWFYISSWITLHLLSELCHFQTEQIKSPVTQVIISWWRFNLLFSCSRWSCARKFCCFAQRLTKKIFWQ